MSTIDPVFPVAAREPRDARVRSLTLVFEQKLFELLPSTDANTRLEASGIDIDGTHFLIVFDNLTRIAKKFGTTGESISYWNRVTYPSLDPESGQYAPNSLQVGWVLQILPKSVVDPENLPTLPPSPELSPEVSEEPTE